MTSLVTMDYEPELAVALGREGADLEKEVRLASALKLFELGRISSGLAARLADMSRLEFLTVCGQYGVSIFQQTADDLSGDIDSALGCAKK